MLVVQGITVSANGWTNAGHAVNQVYDLLYMMGRDDISVGVGGEGGILPNGTILPNVGGYFPIIEQVYVVCGVCLFFFLFFLEYLLRDKARSTKVIRKI